MRREYRQAGSGRYKAGQLPRKRHEKSPNRGRAALEQVN
jgi:hypothetical protein